MNPKPGWVRYMENIYAMLARVDFLDEVRENERKEAAKELHNNVCAFVAHYGQVSTDACPSTCSTYVLLCNGNVLIRKDDEDDNMEEVEVENLSIEEMEALHQFMVDTINHDLQYQEDEIDRYQNLCL